MQRALHADASFLNALCFFSIIPVSPAFVKRFSETFPAGVLRKQLSDDLKAKFGAAKFVEDAFVVHGARPHAPPLLAHADIGQLPDIHARAAGMGEHAFKLAAQRLRLIFFAPLRRIGGTLPVNAARADLGHEKGLARPVRFALYPVVQVAQVFVRRRIVIPERIDIVGYDVGQTEAQIGFELAARKRTRAGGIERTQKGKLFS